MSQIAKRPDGNGKDKGFKAGDIIQGTSGDGRTYACTKTLLLLYIAPQDVSAVELSAYNPLTKERYDKHHDHGRYTLSLHDWKKIGEVPELAEATQAITNAVAEYRK